jgi:hypothetical protein
MSVQGEVSYHKLTGKIFLAGDHLLNRSRSMFTESYRRFYFNEIQYIIIQRTAGWHVRSVLLLVPLTVSVLAAVASHGLLTSTIVAALILGWGLGMNLMAGPSCRVIIRTPLGTQRLYGATTVRRAWKIIQRLSKEITKVQGPLQVEQAAAAPTSNTAADIAAVAPGPAEIRTDKATVTPADGTAPYGQAANRSEAEIHTDSAAVAPGASEAHNG